MNENIDDYGQSKYVVSKMERDIIKLCKLNEIVKNEMKITNSPTIYKEEDSNISYDTEADITQDTTSEIKIETVDTMEENFNGFEGTYDSSPPQSPPRKRFREVEQETISDNYSDMHSSIKAMASTMQRLECKFDQLIELEKIKIEELQKARLSKEQMHREKMDKLTEKLKLRRDEIEIKKAFL